MDTIIIIIIEISLMLLLTVIQTFFYYKTIGFSQKGRGLRLGIVIFFITAINTTLELIAFNIASLSWVGNLIFVTFLLYPLFFMGGKFKEKILFGIVNLAIFMFSTLLTSSILSPGNLVTYTSETSWLAVLLLSCTLIILIYAILVFVVIHLSLEGKPYLPSKYWTGLIISFSIIVARLLAVFSLQFLIEDPEKVQIYFTLFSLVFLVIWLLLYFIFYFVCLYFSKTSEANMLAYQNDMIKQFILQKQASDERIKILSHDLKHSLVKWRAIAEEKRDLVELQSILSYEEHLKSLPYEDFYKIIVGVDSPEETVKIIEEATQHQK